MSVVTSTWHQLVHAGCGQSPCCCSSRSSRSRSCWRVIPSPRGPGSRPSRGTNVDDSLATPVVAEAAAEDGDRRRRVLGVRKDPFGPAPVKTPEPTTQQATAPNTGGSQDTGPTVTTIKPPSFPGIRGTARRARARAEPEPAPYPTPARPHRRRRPTPPTPSSSASATRRATRSSACCCPSSHRWAARGDETPVLIYMGLTNDGKRAKFLVEASVEVDGDGVYKPHPSSCETVELAVGETEFLDVFDPEAEVAEGEEARDPVPAGPRRHQAQGRRGRQVGRALRRGFDASRGGRGAYSGWTACRCASSPPGNPRSRPDLHRRGPARGPRAGPHRDRSRHVAPPARPRPRRADEDRARQRRDHFRRAPWADARRSDRRAGREPRLRQLGGADEPVAGRGRGARGAPPAARPRRPRRRPEVRLHRHTQRPRARERARPRRGWPAAHSPRASSVRSACGCTRMSPRSPRSARRSAARVGAGGLRRGRRLAGALPRRGGLARDGRGINVLRKRNESLGGVFEVRAFGLVPGSART